MPETEVDQRSLAGPQSKSGRESVLVNPSRIPSPVEPSRMYSAARGPGDRSSRPLAGPDDFPSPSFIPSSSGFGLSRRDILPHSLKDSQDTGSLATGPTNTSFKHTHTARPAFTSLAEILDTSLLSGLDCAWGKMMAGGCRGHKAICDHKTDVNEPLSVLNKAFSAIAYHSHTPNSTRYAPEDVRKYLLVWLQDQSESAFRDAVLAAIPTAMELAKEHHKTNARHGAWQAWQAARRARDAACQRWTRDEANGKFEYRLSQ